MITILEQIRTPIFEINQGPATIESKIRKSNVNSDLFYLFSRRNSYSKIGVFDFSSVPLDFFA